MDTLGIIWAIFEPQKQVTLCPYAHDSLIAELNHLSHKRL